MEGPNAAGGGALSELRFGGFRLDPSDERLWGPSGAVKLGNKALRVLERLASQPGRLITKDELFSSVWDGTIVSESALTSVIKELRRALGDETRTPRFIESVYGRGYRFVAALEEGEAEPAPSDAAALTGKGGRKPRRTEEPTLGEPPLLCISEPEDAAVRDLHPFLGETLREEVLSALSRIRDIRLVPDAAPAAQGGYGERDYQLSLKLLGGKERVRAFARLSHLSSGSIIWADNADLGEGEAAGNIDQLVRSIVAAAVPSLHNDMLRNLAGQPEDAYGRYFRNKLQMRCQSGIAEARALAESWEALIADHPGFWQAYPPLMRLYNTDYCFACIGSTGPAERARAHALAIAAIAYEPADSHLHSARAWCHLWAGEPALARLHLEEALRLNPWNQSRLLEAATAFMFLDDLDRASDLIERSRQLTPFAAHAPHEEQGLLHLLRGDAQAAAAELASVRRAHPEDAEGAEPNVLTALYALLAAAAIDAPDLARRSRAWQERIALSWCGEGPPDPPALVAWALNHNPFVSEQRRSWLVGLLEPALRAGQTDGGQDRPRTRAPARPGTRSGPAPAERPAADPPTLN
jgi:DNA-binding winged helix-turn-helix (wHTH) protein/tetratricopeptide (TPR) repeat protein